MGGQIFHLQVVWNVFTVSVVPHSTKKLNLLNNKSYFHTKIKYIPTAVLVDA